MNTSSTSAPWVPFTIPETPNVGPDDNYALFAKQGAVSGKNPSQFLEWKEVEAAGLPDGSSMGDLLKWDPSAGDDGAWVVLNSPNASPDEPQYLKHDGSDAYWDEAIFPEGNSFGDLLQWDPNAGDDGAWIVLEAPTGDNKFLYFKDNSWQVVEAIEFDVCENGEPKTYKIPAIPVEE